jgi:hypothetical protein
MAKAGDLIKELQRRLRHLGRLDGALVRSDVGPVLLDVAGVKDPFVAADLAGPPTLTVLAAALQLRAAPQRVTPAFVARARRDLRALAGGHWQAIVRDAPRLFRGVDLADPAWWSVHDARVTALTAALHPHDHADAWPFALVDALRGPAAVDLLTDWIDRSAAIGLRRRREARRRIDALVRRLGEPAASPEPTGLAVTLDAAARAISRLARPGRSADRRLDLLLRAVLAWPAAPAGHAAPPAPSDSSPAPSDSSPAPSDSSPAAPASLSPAARAALQARVRARSEPLIRALGGARTQAHLAALRRTLTAYVLAFPPDPEDPPPALDPESLELAADRLRTAAAAGLPAGLGLPRALWLLRLPITPNIRAAVTPWIVAGFPPRLLEQVIAHEQHQRLARLQGDVDLAIAYADWLVRLVPHYKQLGVTLELEPAHFARLHATHRGGLALLAHCLVVHHAPGEHGAAAQLARLRATLGLFAARPRRAEALLADLSLAPAGLGRRHFADFADWLQDDALLDRFCHLAALAGEPVALSNTLRRDLERIPRIQRQRDWLAARPERTPEQASRLAHLTAEIAASELADPAWTRRRLAERCDALLARAFARRQDEILRELLLEAIGVAPPTLTPAWRDAVRFFLGEAERNRGLLTRLLRHAAAEPGRPIAATLPLGQAWLARAAARMRTDPWLAPRRRPLELHGHRLTIALEDDPLEVLRMGIPFDTCLSLTDGFNAESTILNAVDPNKRVLYVRDARGAVVARKLLAVSSEFTLLGYRLYTVRGDLPGLADAVREFCRELADECALPLADVGVPAEIHPGFWYDDNTAAWTGLAVVSRTSLAAYFARMGHAPPAALSDWATRVLHAWDAWACADAPRARTLLPQLRHHSGSAHEGLGDLLAAHLGPRALVRAARLDDDLAVVHLAQIARNGAPALLHAAAAYGKYPSLLGDVAWACEHAPSSAAVARAWLAALPRTRRDAPHFDDHGIEHQSTRIDRHLAHLPIAELLAACAELDATWQWILEHSPGCTDCIASGEYNLRRAAEAAHARAPDPAAALVALQGRRGRLAQSLALHLAARFSLAPRPCPLGHGLGATWISRLLQRPVAAPPALTALRALRRHRPDLADSADMFAALVRQAGPLAAHTDLPDPDESPLPILNEFLLHLPDPHVLLAPWLDPAKRDPVAWEPGLWTLHVHRRGMTAWRRRLGHLADQGGEHARRWVARLGDTAAWSGSSYRALAQDITRQLAHPPGFWDTPDPPDVTALVPDNNDPQMIDLALVAEAVRTLHRAPSTANTEPLARAITVLERASLGHGVWPDLLTLLVPEDRPPAAHLAPFIARLLARPELRGVDRGLVARMSADRELHPALRARLVDDISCHFDQVHTTYSRVAAEPCPDPAARDALLADFVAAAGAPAAEIDTPLGCDDRARFLACLPIFSAHAAPEWLAVYRALHDPHFQLLALDARLAAITPEHRQQLRDLVAADWDPPEHDHDEAAARAWLLAALA